MKVFRLLLAAFLIFLEANGRACMDALPKGTTTLAQEFLRPINAILVRQHARSLQSKLETLSSCSNSSSNDDTTNTRISLFSELSAILSKISKFPVKPCQASIEVGRTLFNVNEILQFIQQLHEYKACLMDLCQKEQVQEDTLQGFQELDVALSSLIALFQQPYLRDQTMLTARSFIVKPMDEISARLSAQELAKNRMTHLQQILPEAVFPHASQFMALISENPILIAVFLLKKTKRLLAFYSSGQFGDQVQAYFMDSTKFATPPYFPVSLLRLCDDEKKLDAMVALLTATLQNLRSKTEVLLEECKQKGDLTLREKEATISALQAEYEQAKLEHKALVAGMSPFKPCIYVSSSVPESSDDDVLPTLPLNKGRDEPDATTLFSSVEMLATMPRMDRQSQTLPSPRRVSDVHSIEFNLEVDFSVPKPQMSRKIPNEQPVSISSTKVPDPTSENLSRSPIRSTAGGRSQTSSSPSSLSSSSSSLTSLSPTSTPFVPRSSLSMKPPSFASSSSAVIVPSVTFVPETVSSIMMPDRRRHIQERFYQYPLDAPGLKPRFSEPQGSSTPSSSLNPAYSTPPQLQPSLERLPPYPSGMGRSHAWSHPFNGQ